MKFEIGHHIFPFPSFAFKIVNARCNIHFSRGTLSPKLNTIRVLSRDDRTTTTVTRQRVEIDDVDGLLPAHLWSVGGPLSVVDSRPSSPRQTPHPTLQQAISTLLCALYYVFAQPPGWIRIAHSTTIYVFYSDIISAACNNIHRRCERSARTHTRTHTLKQTPIHSKAAVRQKERWISIRSYTRIKCSHTFSNMAGQTAAWRASAKNIALGSIHTDVTTYRHLHIRFVKASTNMRR